MTIPQVKLLLRLIDADRRYRTSIARKELAHNDDRGIEIGWINAVHPNTADSLVKLGVAEIVNLRERQNYIFLGKYQPYDNDEEK